MLLLLAGGLLLGGAGGAQRGGVVDVERRAERRHEVGGGDAAEHEFGPCSLLGDCTEVCPAGLPLENLTAVARENLRRKDPRKYG